MFIGETSLAMKYAKFLETFLQCAKVEGFERDAVLVVRSKRVVPVFCFGCLTSKEFLPSPFKEDFFRLAATYGISYSSLGPKIAPAEISE